MAHPVLLANVLAPYVAWGVGNDIQLSLPYSMLATLMVGVMERPFVTWAGFDRRAMLLSLRANILSWLFGATLVYFSIVVLNDRRGSIFLVMYAIAVPFSIAVEGGYLARMRRRARVKMNWWPIIAGNCMSGIILILVTGFGLENGDRMQVTRAPLVLWLEDHKALLYRSVLGVCAAGFLVILAVPDGLRSRKPPQPAGEPANVVETE
jgi:hypothetical protein